LFPHLFQPLELRHKTLRHRLNFGAHTANMAERGHQVTLVTPHAMVGSALVRTTADWPLRRKFKELGVASITDAALAEWHGDGASVIDLRDGTRHRHHADALVLATCNRAGTALAEALAGSGLEIHAIGDCVAPRLANMAFYEGRKLGLGL